MTATLTRVITERPTVTVTTGAHGTLICVAGRIDGHTAADLRAELHDIIDNAISPLHLDLSDAELGDATALGLLVECHRRGRRRGHEMRLIAASARSERLLRRLALTRQYGVGAARA